MPDPRAALTCHFASGDTLLSRSVSDIVLSAVLDVPAPPAKLSADWAREIGLQLELQAGDVEPLPLARTRARWPNFRHGLEAAAHWTRSLGLGELLAEADLALMACRGARHHHDATQYGGSAFCNLFLTPDQGLDLLFAATGQRIPLVQGTAVIFDTGQPHAVVRRGSQHFIALDFENVPSCAQVFVSWELPIDHASVAQALQVTIDPAACPTGPAGEHGLWRDGQAVDVNPETGQWQQAASPSTLP